jgi:hypothetical protein
MIRFLRAGVLIHVCFGAGMAPSCLHAQSNDGAPRSRRPSWDFSVAALTQAESNARFDVGSNRDDWYRQITGSITGGIASARSRLSVQTRGDVTRYDRFQELDRLTYDVSALGSRIMSSSLTMEARGSVGRVTSTAFGPTGADLATLPLIVANSLDGHVQADIRKSGRTKFVAATGITQLRFDAANFPDGRTFDGGVQMTHKLQGASTIGATASATKAELGQQDFVSTVGSGTWAWARNKWSLKLGAGAVMLTGDSIATPEFGPTAQMEVRRTALRGVVTASVSHGTIPALGVGRPLVTNQAAVSVERRGFLGTTMRAGGDYFRGTSATGNDQPFSAKSLTAEIRRSLFGGVWLQVGGFLRTRVFGEEVANRGVYLSGGYTKSVRR